MTHFAIAPGLFLDAEVDYRRERTARDLSDARGMLVTWWASRRDRRRSTVTDLTLAA